MLQEIIRDELFWSRWGGVELLLQGGEPWDRVNPEAGSTRPATHPKGSVARGTLQEVTQSPDSSSGSAGS